MKKYVKSDVDYSEDSKYQQIFADVSDAIFDHIAGRGIIQPEEMKRLVPKYDPSWCAEDFIYDDHWKEVVKTAKRLSQLIADDYFRNY